MSRTNSIAFPNMLDPARNQVSIIEDGPSIVNRTRLLFLSEPTELYNEPEFGLGLRRYIFQYNTENVRAMIQDRMKEKLREYEPCVDPDKTSFADGLMFTGSNDALSLYQDENRLKMTVGLSSIYGDELEVTLNDAYTGRTE